MRTLAAAAAGLLSLGLALRAHAGCVLPEQFLFVPGTGSPVPSNPQILVYLHIDHPSYEANQLDGLEVVDAEGRDLTFEREPLKTVPHVVLVRVSVNAKRGSVSVRARAGKTVATATYPIASKWRPPSEDTEILDVSYEYATGCPSSDGFLLGVRPRAPAYEVRDGDSTWVVPAYPYRQQPGVGIVATGFHGCWEFAIPTRKPFELSITPVFPDGAFVSSYLPGCRSGPSKKTRNGSVLGGVECHGGAWFRFHGKLERD